MEVSWHGCLHSSRLTAVCWRPLAHIRHFPNNITLRRPPAGQTDPGAPLRADGTRKRTYKTKKETDKTRNVTSTIVLTLLGISVIVPMLQVRALRLLCHFL